MKTNPLNEAAPAENFAGPGPVNRAMMRACSLRASAWLRSSIAWPARILVLLLLPAAVQAQFNYTTNEGAITITGYTGPGDAVTIPSTMDGLPVLSIGNHAFEFTSLTNVTIPETVTSIGHWAFGGCTSLPNLTIPNSATSIGDNAFGGCPSLTAFTVDALNTAYGSSVDGVRTNTLTSDSEWMNHARRFYRLRSP